MDICTGLINKEFEFFYQPIISLNSGQLCGAEALIRWRRPDGSIVPPASFIPLAEETGFITEITKAMYPVLIDDLASIPDIDPSFFITINLTTADLNLEHIAENIGTLLSIKGISHKRLGIEIVESVLLPPNSIVRKTISAFDEQGIPVVLNDFSAGNTTLNYLSQLPLSALKLSLDIVQRAPVTLRDFKIFRHLVSMAHQLKLNVIAEGVENQELYDLILSTGCTSAQGFYFSIPLPKSEFIEFINRQHRWGKYPFGIEYLAQIDLIDFRRDFIREALIIYTNPDDDVKKRARARLPLIRETSELLDEWYFGVGKENLNLPDIERLRKIHQQSLEIVKRLLLTAESGDTWENMDKLITELTEQSSETMRTLQKLATEKLIAHYAPPKAIS